MTEPQAINLITSLGLAGIPLSHWGNGKYKTLKHLIEELDNGEARLDLENPAVVFRYTKVVFLDIFYIDEITNNFLRLVEEKQVYKDGRERIRKQVCSVAEKLLIGEDPTVGLKRALKEELGIETAVRAVFKEQTKTQPQSSQSYLGLKSVREEFRYTVYLTKEQFKPKGYIECQKDKTTYFVWV